MDVMDKYEQGRRLMARFHRLEFQGKNESMVCAVSACARMRSGHSKLCAAHKTRQVWTGHAEGRKIYRREVEPFEQQFKRFKLTYPDHPAILASEQWLDALLQNPRRFLKEQVAIDRLEGAAMRGANGRQLLEVLAGPFLMSLFDPQALPDDGRLSTALVKATFSSWRRGRGGSTSSRDNADPQKPLRRPATVYRLVGGLIREHIGVLFERVHARMTRDANELQALRTELHTPFVTQAELEAAQRFDPDHDPGLEAVD